MKARELVIGKLYRCSMNPGEVFMYMEILTGIYIGQHRFDNVDKDSLISGCVCTDKEVPIYMSEVIPVTIHDIDPSISHAFIHLYDGLNDDDEEGKAELARLEDFIVKVINERRTVNYES